MPTNHLLNDHKQHDEREDMMVYEKTKILLERIYIFFPFLMTGKNFLGGKKNI